MADDFMKFLELVRQDETIRKKLEEAGKNYTGDQTEEKVFESIIAPIARDAGMTFTLDDMKQSVRELSPDEMEQVGGGAGKKTSIGRRNDNGPAPNGSGFGGGFCQVIGVGALGAITDQGGVVCLIVGGGWGGENICFEEGYSG